MLTGLFAIESTSDRLRLNAAVLQLLGLLVVVQSLSVKGAVFSKNHPFKGLRSFLRGIRRAFQKPRVVQLEAESIGIAADMSDAQLVVSKAPSTLEERVERLEEGFKDLADQLSEDTEFLLEQFRGFEDEARDRHRQLSARVEGFWGDVRTTLAGSYEWEWVAIVWLLVGMCQQLLAEVLG